MFKNIGINLAGPICKCESQNLIWGIVADKDLEILLYISCATCSVKIQVPYKQIFAYFNLEKKYPKGILQPQKTDSVEEQDQKFLKDMRITPNFKADT